MKRLTAAVLFLIAAGFASAQTYTYTFTSPAGSIKCQNVKPYQEWYSNLVENSTPPYPNALQPGNFFMPAMPNHPFPVENGGCPYMTGFVSANGVTGHTEGNGFRTSQQMIYTQNPVWSATWASAPNYPAEGEPVLFTLDEEITTVCTQVCQAASGNLHLEGHFAFHWMAVRQSPSTRWILVEKVWTSTDDTVLDGQSTVMIQF